MRVQLPLTPHRALRAEIGAVARWTRVTIVLLTAVFSIAIGAAASAAEDFHDLIRRQFEIYDPDYQIHRERYGERLKALAEELAEAQASGRNLHCSQQMFLEAKWLHRYTAHWSRLADKLKRIEKSLGNDDQSFATRQLPTDGLWGICHEELFMRLSATIDGLSGLSERGENPRYRLRSTGKLNTGKKLLSRLSDLLISDIANTGVNNRAELSSLMTTLSQGVFKPYLRDMIIESIDLRSSSNLDNLTEAFRFFLSGAQDPATGYWGAWYVVDGKIHKSVDLSMTYHIVNYTKGRVEHWPQIIGTTSAIEADKYPYGWRHNGRYNNHNLYDVAKIYRFGWPHMSEFKRDKVRLQLQSMLAWSLANSFNADGTFAVDSSFSDSLADEYYFGVSFLDVMGYWQHGRPFWRDTPSDEDAAATCCRLKHQLEKLEIEGWAAEGAKKKLARNCGLC